MKISCPNCSAAYELDDARVPPAGLSIKCPKCKNPFTVHRPKGDAAAKKPGAVPLPGQAGGPAPAAKPAAAKAVAPAAGKPPGAQKGAVPLPGMGAAAPARAANGPVAVPLPGQAGGPSAPPPMPSDAVPLPGLDAQSDSAEDTALDFRPPPSAPPSAPGMGSGPAVPLPGLDDATPKGGPAFSAPKPAAARGAAEPDDPFANIEMGAPAPAPKASPPPSAPPAKGDNGFSLDVPDVQPKPSNPPPAVLPDDGMGFDFVEAPPRPPPSAPPGGDMLDFVDDAPRPPPAAGKGKKVPPPLVPAADQNEKTEETLSLAEQDAGELMPKEQFEAEQSTDKKAEKERKKRERAERAARDREERAARKAARGPGMMATSLAPALRDFGASLRQPKRAAAAVAVLAVIVVIVFGFRARRTPAGFFWANKYMPTKREATASEVEVIRRGTENLGKGDFAGAREAVAKAAGLLGVLPDDEEVKAFFVLSASELKLDYGQVGADWDQAKRVIEKMKANKPSQNRARGAFALASGDFPRGKATLAPLDSSGADLESTYLYCQSLLLSGEWQRAAQTLDAAIKKNPAVKLLLLRGKVARDRDQLTDAAGFYKQALEKAPDNGRAMVELAAVRLKQGDAKGAEEMLQKALDTDVRKSLDAAEEARGNMLRGRMLASGRDAKGAEAAYERAVLLDPNSGRIHEDYGKYRLSRREWDKAARQFEAAIPNGGSAEAYAGAARAYLGLNRLLEADKDVNQAVAKDPNDAAFLLLQGRVADAIGKAEEAFRKYEAALQKKPDFVEALTAEGMVWISRNDKAKARERFDTAMKTPGDKSSAAEDEAIGELALALGEKDQALTVYSRALQKDPDDPSAHAGLGKALAAQGKLPEARKEMETALQSVDNDASLYYEYGSLLWRLNDPDGALEALRKAVKLDSKDSRYRARLGAVLVEKGEFSEAEAQLHQAVLLNDRYGEALFYLARALTNRDKAAAIDTMKKAVELEPDNADYLYWLGLIYEGGQQVQDAIDAYTKAIARNPTLTDAHEHLGQNLMVENRFDEAVTAFKKAADIDPKRPRLWAEVGDAEQQAGDVDGAVRDFQRALSQDSTLTGVWTKLGIAYKDKDCKGCRTKALDALRRATHEDPTDAAAHHELGYMLKDDGKRKEAIAEFKRYLELRPDAGDAPTVQDDIYYLQEESRRSP